MNCTDCGVAYNFSNVDHRCRASNLKSQVYEELMSGAPYERLQHLREKAVEAEAREKIERAERLEKYGATCVACGGKFMPLPWEGVFCSIGCEITYPEVKQ